MFQRLLIANRGEVAVRIARACRELGIAPLGVASEADRGASWTEAFDELCVLGPAASSASYLDATKLVQAALQMRASAIHPGWGFLAENPRFANLCRQHGITFVGPAAGVMRRMALKSPAKLAMREAGLDVVPGSDGPVPDVETALAVAREAGYPVLLKADSGGGGRGMRLASNDAELRTGFAAARAEALAAFGRDVVYLERYLAAGRHVEVQLLCDAYGHGVHLYDRECSIQRKHQKLIEESPSPALSAEEREELGRRAVRAALEVGYENAGTIEFLRASTGETYFMEMNTRLQVEHPVSELVTGVDVATSQIEVAAQRPLRLRQEDIRLNGAAIECRINAEDPSDDFRPTPGTLESFEIPSDVGPGTVRVDTHLKSGDKVSPHYDSLLAKVITWAPTREQAIETMEAALAKADIRGVSTTISLHRAVLASEAFRSGEYDTSTIPGWS